MFALFGVVALAAATLAVTRKKPAPTAAPEDDSSAVPDAAVVPPSQPSPTNTSGLGDLLKGVLPEIGSAGLAGVAATVTSGIVVSELAGRFTEDVLGKNQASGDTSRVFGAPAVIGQTVQVGTDKLLDVIGVDGPIKSDVSETAGLAAAAATVLGGVAIIPIIEGKLLAEGASALIGLVAGEQAEKDVRSAVRELDPTASGTAAAAVVGAVGGVVQGAANVVLGAFGIDARPRDANGNPLPTPEEVANAELAARVQAQAEMDARLNLTETKSGAAFRSRKTGLNFDPDA